MKNPILNPFPNPNPSLKPIPNPNPSLSLNQNPCLVHLAFKVHQLLSREEGAVLRKRKQLLHQVPKKGVAGDHAKPLLNP
jgi:hypothetical protein